MISNIDEDRLVLKNQVEDALKVLQSQMLVQKNGKLYVFLTDEEQEINREIESQPVDKAEVISKVSEMIFEDIFDDKKYKYPAFNGRYAFSFNQTVDDKPYKANQNYDFGLKILTPWYDGGMDDTTLRMMSGQGKEVLVVLPDDAAFLNELHRYLKIEKFLRLNTSAQLTKYETIKEAKRVEMRERNSNAKLYLTEALKSAVVYVNGDVANISAKEVTSRINEAIGRLVQTVYHKLSYIDAAMGEAEIRKLFTTSNQMSLDMGGVAEPNQHALDDVLAYIAGNSHIHMKTSMKSLKERFMKAPYGFVEDDVHWLVAKLFKKGDLTFTVNGAGVTLLNKDAEEIISFITKKQFVEKLLIEERIKVPEKEKKAVRTVLKELFNTSSASDDEDTQMRNFQRYSESMYHEMEKLEVNYNHYAYPGKKVITDGKKLFQAVMQISAPIDFFDYISKHQDEFLDLAEDFDPIRKFFGGEQQQIFMKTLDMLEIYDDSKTYIVDTALEDIVKQMRDIIGKTSPYQDIPKLPDLRQKFIDAYSKVLNEAAIPVMASIADAQKRVVEVVETKEYVAEKKTKYIELFVEIRMGAEKCNNVSVLRSYADKADALKIRLLNEMDQKDAEIAKQKAEEAKKAAEEQAANNGGQAPMPTDVVVKTPVKKTKNLTIKNVTQTSTWRLESEADVDTYVAKLKEKLLAELKDNDIVNIEF